MKLTTDQLNQHLTKQLLPVYLVSGDEPLLIQEACDAIRAQCRQAGFNERQTFQADKSFNWNSLSEEVDALSLFAEKKLLEITLPSGKPGDAGSKAIEHYCSNTTEDRVLLIITGKIDKATLKRKWVTAIDHSGGILQIWPVDQAQLPQWVSKRLKMAGFTADQDALAMLCEKTEGNLLAAQQEIDKLALLQSDNHLTLESITSSISESARYDVFDLTNACLNKNLTQAIRICQALRDEGTEKTIVLWALTREIRLLYALATALHKNLPAQEVFKQQRMFIPKKQKQLLSAAPSFNLSTLNHLIYLAEKADHASKGIDRESDAWQLINDIIILLCGHTIFV